MFIVPAKSPGFSHSGLGYFIIAVVAQTLNLVFLLSTVRRRAPQQSRTELTRLQDKSKQNTMITLQTVVTTILAQRISTFISPTKS